jgi:hypothetical protein
MCYKTLQVIVHAVIIQLLCVHFLNSCKFSVFCYYLKDQGSVSGKDEDFSYCHCVQSGSGTTQTPVQWVPVSLSIGINWLKCGAYSSPSSTDVQSLYVCVWFYLHLSYILMAWSLDTGTVFYLTQCGNKIEDYF